MFVKIKQQKKYSTSSNITHGYTEAHDHNHKATYQDLLNIKFTITNKVFTLYTTCSSKKLPISREYFYL